MQVIEFHTTDKFLKEKEYFLNIINDFIQVKCKIVIDPSLTDCYIFKLKNNRELVCSDTFFSKFQDGIEYIQEKNIPTKVSMFKNPFELEKELPVIFGKPNLVISSDKITCEIDILASVFFMLSRWEEIANRNRDKFDRFAGKDSLAHKAGFLRRPIVNEYCELLLNLLQKIGYSPSAENNRKFKIRYSCDVDLITNRASYRFLSFIKALSIFAQNRYAYDNIKAIVENYFKHKNSYDTFRYIYRQLHQHQVEGAFYFITINTSSNDSDYDFNGDAISKLMKEITSEGFEVGLHPSFETYKNKEQLYKEYQTLLTKTEKLGISQNSYGGRQHFLKWDPASTYRNWEHAGLSYDSTLGYADLVGFRSGTCYDFRIFDPLDRKELNLIERPLIMMETSLIDKKYMDKGYSEEAYAIVKELKHQCEIYKGSFNFLWHNSHLLIDRDKELFEYCLAGSVIN